MRILLILALFFGITSCASNEEIAAFVQTCNSINAKIETVHYYSSVMTCWCERSFQIIDNGDKIIEVNK